MKTSVLSTPSIASADTQESAMDMSAKGMDMASYFLRDKIYKDKPLACIREYICNALDEHSKFDISRPVDVKMENSSDGKTIWSVRDYAKGLDDHGVRYIFGRYFESTKSGNNDAIGGFGIGSKAFHCFTDTFYIISYFEGTKTTYACILGGSASGVPIGKIYELGKEDTTESGIEINADVGKDGWGFQTKTVAFVKDLPESTNIEFVDNRTAKTLIVKPDEVTTSKDLGDNIQISTYGKTADQNYGRWGYDNKEYRIRMGGVVYTSRSFSKSSFSLSVVVDVPIGTFDIPISREDFESTPKNDKAYALIDSKLKDLFETESASMAGTPRCIKTALIDNARIHGSSKTPGEFFVYNTRQLYETSNEFLCHTSWFEKPTADADPPVCGNNKKVRIFVFPSIKNTTNWHIRLDKFLNTITDYNGYIGICESCPRFLEFEAQSGDILNDADFSKVEFVRVKEMGLPTLPKKAKGDASSRQYAVYDNCGKNVGYFTAEEWKKHLETELGITFKTTSDLIDDPAPKYEAIAAFSFNDNPPTQQYNRHRTSALLKPKYYFRSEKFKEGLLKLGFLRTNDPKVTAYETNRQKILTEKEERRKSLSTVTTNYPFITNKLVLDRVTVAGHNRISAMFAKIANEQSLRGKIFKQFEDSPYYDKPEYSRADVRRILKMKG